jgi:hypothetical protein
MITATFRNCIVEIWPETRYLQTVYQDGRKVPAAPEDTAEYRAQAEARGYGGDTWLLCCEHEPCHTWLAEKLGQPWSWTLWWVAHKDILGKPPKGLWHDEEELVLAFQQYANTGECQPLRLWKLQGMQLDLLVMEWRWFLANLGRGEQAA